MNEWDNNEVVVGSPQLGGYVWDIASNMMLVEEHVLWMAQNEARACTRIVQCVERIADMALTTEHQVISKVHTHTHTHTRRHAHAHAQAGASACKDTHTHTHACTDTSTCMYRHTCTHAQTHQHACTDTRMHRPHKHTHTHTHTHAHAGAHSRSYPVPLLLSGRLIGC